MVNKANPEPGVVILAGGPGRGLNVLAEPRAIASVPFAGKYRIIDFVLSNCVNSDLNNLLILTQYNPLSLHRHIGNGRPWDLDRQRGGIRMVSPYLGPKDAGWDRGTADAVYRNLDQVLEMDADLIMILGGDHVYKMNYQLMLDFHRHNNADVTIGVVHVPFDEASRFGVMTVDGQGRVTRFAEKPSQPESNLISMGIYVFNKETLVKVLTEVSEERRRDFGRDIIPQMLEKDDAVYAYPFEGYWRDIGTVQSFWQTNMDLLRRPPELNLFDRDWVIYTRSEERPPALTSDHSRIEHSLISNGCEVHGQVIRSVLSPGVIVEEGAVVRDSVIFGDTVIGRNSLVDRAIIDKNVVVGANSLIGFGENTSANKLDLRALSAGITVVGKGAVLPQGLRVGRNVKIGAGVTATDFSSLTVETGETVEAEKRD
jgi:glucose-1-phosphate adenylyltransferase